MVVISSVAFLILAALAAGLVGFVGSLLFGLVGSLYVPVRKAFGHATALLVVTFVNSVLIIAWTAFIMLWLERNAPPYNLPTWVEIIGGILIATGPTSFAWRGVVRNIHQRLLNEDEFGLAKSLKYVMTIQILAAVYMFFDRSALHWWRWLPLTS